MANLRPKGKPTTGGENGKKQTFEEQVCIVAGWLSLLTDGVFEIRALDVTPANGGNWTHTESGYFDRQHLTEAARTALQLTPRAKSVYVTLNALDDALLARRCNRISKVKDGDATKDNEVTRRRWLYIDVDPVRPTNVSATDEEKTAARELVDQIREHLHERGWPAPILGDSGNGNSLFYRVDLPKDNGGLVERCLKALAQRFDNKRAHVDVSVNNPSRIVKVPGTLARKGDNAPEAGRPHRRSRLLAVPGCPDPRKVQGAALEVALPNLLEELAAELKVEVPPVAAPSTNGVDAGGTGSGHRLNGQVPLHSERLCANTFRTVEG